MTEKTMELEKKEVQTPAENQQRLINRTIKPRIDLYEAGDTLMLVADLPGVAEDNIEIMLEKDRLTIRGLVEDRVPEGFRAVYTEHYLANYERSFILSDEIDRDNIEASFSQGVLRLSLPKAESAKTRKISVTTAS